MNPQDHLQSQQSTESKNIQESEISKTESLKKEERIRTTELNEIKKHLNGLINRRAVAISSRYEGTNQDEKLHQLSSLLGRYEQEITRVQSLLKKNKTGKSIPSSSPMVENNSMMPAEKLLSKLNKDCDATKEKVPPPPSHHTLLCWIT
jgi:glutaminase